MSAPDWIVMLLAFVSLVWTAKQWRDQRRFDRSPRDQWRREHNDWIVKRKTRRAAL